MPVNVPVNYCSKSILTVPYTNPDFAKLQVLAKCLSSKYLHPELRERQGAYGGGALISMDGVFTFFSYRDPRNTQTLDVFDQSYSWLEANLSKITSQELLESKLGVFQTVDAPIPPANKGVSEFLVGLNPDVLQRHSAELMAINHTDLNDVAQKYLTGRVPSKTGKVILGPKNLETGDRAEELWTVVENE